MGTVTIHSLLKNTENSLEYTASNGRMLNETSVGIEVEGNGVGLLEVLTLHLRLIFDTSFTFKRLLFAYAH
jgi:hypothetical protein